MEEQRLSSYRLAKGIFLARENGDSNPLLNEGEILTVFPSFLGKDYTYREGQ